MFQLFYDRLMGNVAELDQCYEPLSANVDADTPYVVFDFGPEISDDGIYSDATIYINVHTELYSQIDPISRKCAMSLNRYKGISYSGTSGIPFFDQSLKLWINTLIFNVGRVNTQL